MFGKDSIIVGPPTRVKLLSVKHVIYDLEGHHVGHLVRQPKSVAFYYEDIQGKRLCEVRLESHKGIDSSMFIYDQMNVMRGYIVGGGHKESLQKDTRYPDRLCNSLGQTVALTDQYTYNKMAGSYEGARSVGFAIRDPRGKEIARVHNSNGLSPGIQIDLLDKDIEQLPVLGLIATEITNIGF